jgi:hypothetical protein
MWRHRENLSLLEAAQLWAEVRPNMTWGTRGSVKDTYAMLKGAIQKGDLAFDPEGTRLEHCRANRKEEPKARDQTDPDRFKDVRDEIWI